MGKFHGTVMYEGRDHRMPKTPMTPTGWEFNKLIPLSTPLQVNDLRWHSNRELTKEIIRSAFAAQDEESLFYLVDGDKDFVREMLPKMKRYIAGHERKYTDGKDSLLIEMIHDLTGKEYQPGYWYFHGFPADPTGDETYMPLKRVDRSVYHYRNLCGMANLLEALGEEEEKLYRRKAETLRQDILEKMWDEETGFFYDLHYQTGEKAFVRNSVGIYPYWAEMTEEAHEKGILPLMDREAFAPGYGFASVSKDCPAFSPAGGWMGNFLKGRNGSGAVLLGPIPRELH